MKLLKSITLSIFSLIIITSCDEDKEDNPTPSTSIESSASINFNGATYSLASDDKFTFLDASFNGKTSYYASGNLVNGTDTIYLSLDLNQLKSGIFTTDEKVSISITDETVSPSVVYSTNGPIFTSVEDLTERSVNVTTANTNEISGDFTAIVQKSISFSADTIHIHGTFTAENFLSSFN